MTNEEDADSILLNLDAPLGAKEGGSSSPSVVIGATDGIEISASRGTMWIYEGDYYDKGLEWDGPPSGVFHLEAKYDLPAMLLEGLPYRRIGADVFLHENSGVWLGNISSGVLKNMDPGETPIIERVSGRGIGRPRGTIIDTLQEMKRIITKENQRDFSDVWCAVCEWWRDECPLSTAGGHELGNKETEVEVHDFESYSQNLVTDERAAVLGMTSADWMLTAIAARSDDRAPMYAQLASAAATRELIAQNAANDEAQESEWAEEEAKFRTQMRDETIAAQWWSECSWSESDSAFKARRFQEGAWARQSAQMDSEDTEAPPSDVGVDWRAGWNWQDARLADEAERQLANRKPIENRP